MEKNMVLPIHTKQGYSLLELSFALLFAALIIGAATYTYANVAEQSRTATFMAQHQMLIAKVSAYFKERSPKSYIASGSTASIRPLLYNRSVIPQTIGQQGTHMASGKLCNIKAQVVNNRQVWTVNYQKISKSSCMALLEAAVGVNNANLAQAQKIFQIDTDTTGNFFNQNKLGNLYTRININDACPKKENTVRMAYIFG